MAVERPTIADLQARGRKSTRRASARVVSGRFGYVRDDDAPPLQITARFLSTNELPASVLRRVPKETDRRRWLRAYNRRLARGTADPDVTFEEAKRDARRAADESVGLRKPGGR